MSTKLKALALLNSIIENNPDKRLGEIFANLADLGQLLETSDDKLDWLWCVEDEKLIPFLEMLDKGKGPDDSAKEYRNDILLNYKRRKG